MLGIDHVTARPEVQNPVRGHIGRTVGHRSPVRLVLQVQQSVDTTRSVQSGIIQVLRDARSAELNATPVLPLSRGHLLLERRRVGEAKVGVHELAIVGPQISGRIPDESGTCGPHPRCIRERGERAVGPADENEFAAPNPRHGVQHGEDDIRGPRALHAGVPAHLEGVRKFQGWVCDLHKSMGDSAADG